MRARRITFSLFALSFASLVVVSAAPIEDPIVFEDARMIIEYNATDQDVGMQIFLDGDPWNSVRVKDPQGRTILDITGRSSLNQQGLTELFFESSEPPLDELSLAQFKARFPAGTYTFTGRTIDGEAIRGSAVFTHRIPSAPVIVSPAEGAVVNAAETFVDWNPVPNPPGGQITAYQVLVTQVLNVLPERVFSVHVPASVTRVTVPPEFLVAGADYDLEVLAIEAGGNQTITTGKFRTSAFVHPNDK